MGDNKILKKITDGEHAGQKFVSKGVLFIKNSSVKEFDISLNDGFYIEEWKHTELVRSALKPLDVLFTTIGHLGSSTVVSENLGPSNINQNLVKLEINNDYINSYYLSAYLNSFLVKQQIAALFTGNIHGILTYPKIKSLEIIKPSDDFQNNIAVKYQTAVQNSYRSNKLILEALAFLRESLNLNNNNISNKQMFDCNINQLKNSGFWTPKHYFPRYVTTINEIKRKWPTKPLSGKDGIADISKGDEVGSDQYNIYLERLKTDVPFIRTSDIYNYEIDQNPDFFIPQEAFNLLFQNICPTDILFTKDGKIGKTALVTDTDKFIAASGLAIIKAEKINPYYLFLCLTLDEIGQYQAIQNTVFASTIPHLRESRFEKFEIPILPNEIIEELSSKVYLAFLLKEERKKLIKEITSEIEGFVRSQSVSQ